MYDILALTGLVAYCWICAAVAWHYYDVAQQAKGYRAYWYDRHAELLKEFARLRLERDEWQRKHRAAMLVMKALVAAKKGD